MKEMTVRTPDEGELWSNGSIALWYVVKGGRMRKVEMAALKSARSPEAVRDALNNFHGSGYGDPCVNIHSGVGTSWSLRAESCVAEVEHIVLTKLNAYQEDLRQASCALARFVS